MICGCDGSTRSTTQLSSSRIAVLNSCFLLVMKLSPILRLWPGHKKAATVSQTMRLKSPRRSRDPCSAILLLMNYHTSYIVLDRCYYSAEPVAQDVTACSSHVSKKALHFHPSKMPSTSARY